MPRKKLSPSYRSTEDENYSEEIESDSSLELNSRRNTYRKRPQRKGCLKQRHNDSLESTGKSQRYIEKSEKRPPIIKIFRRIDRKAKNIYLVDDKVEDWNKIVSPPVSKADSHISDWEKNPLSEEPTSEIFLFDSCALPLRKIRERSTRIVKEYSKEHDFVEVGVGNLSGDDDTSYSSATSTGKTAEESGIDDQNYPCNTDDLYSPVTDISETSDSDDTLNKPCNTEYLYSPVTDVSESPSKDDIWNNTSDGLYSPVTDVSQVPDRDDTWNKPCSTEYDLYPPVIDVSVTLGKDDAWKRSCDTHDLYSPVTDVLQAPARKNVLNQPCGVENFYSLVTDIAKKHCKADVWNQPRDIETFYPSETDIDQTPNRNNVCNQRLSSDSDSPNSWETDIDQTLIRDSVCSQRLDNDFVVPEFPTIEIEKSSGKYGNFDILYSDPNVLSDGKNLNIKSINFNYILNSDHDASYLLSSKT